MNYRVLFIISFLIIGIGVSGLFLISSPDEGTGKELSVKPEPEKEKIVITTARLNKPVEKGSLIQVSDYSLNELSVDIDDPLVNFNLHELIKASSHNGIQGYLILQNLEQGAFISPQNLLAPTDPSFLFSSINPSQEAAYKVYIDKSQSYILDTLLPGQYVSVYSRQDAENTLNPDLLKIIDKSLVLYTQKYSDDKENNENPKKDDEIVGDVSLKLSSEQIKQLYSLPKDNLLVLLPTASEKAPEHINNKGVLIRKLRGH